MTWNIGTTGSMRSVARSPSTSGMFDAVGVQQRRAVAVQHALRPARSCRRCSTARWRCSRRTPARRSPRRAASISVFVAEQVHAGGQRDVRHVRRRRSSSPRRARDAARSRRDGFDQRGEARFGEQHAVAGMVDDVGDVVGGRRGLMVWQIASMPARRSRAPDGGEPFQASVPTRSLAPTPSALARARRRRARRSVSAQLVRWMLALDGLDTISVAAWWRAALPDDRDRSAAGPASDPNMARLQRPVLQGGRCAASRHRR